MPLYDFRCDYCGHVQEKLFKCLDDAVQQPVLCEHCNALSVRVQSAPAQLIVNGFSAMNGYASQRTMNTRIGNTKVEVKGNFEAFSEGLHK